MWHRCPALGQVLAKPGGKKKAAETFFKGDLNGVPIKVVFARDRGQGIVKVMVGKLQKCQVTVAKAGSKERAVSIAVEMAKRLAAGTVNECDLFKLRAEMIPSGKSKQKHTKSMKRPASAITAPPVMSDESQALAAIQSDESEAAEDEEAEEEEAEEEAMDEDRSMQ